MSGLALFLQKQGFCVAGSDIAAGSMTAKLEEEGIRVHYGHAPERIGIADAIVVNSAIAEDDVELAEARRRNIPVYSRAELLQPALKIPSASRAATAKRRRPPCVRTFWKSVRAAVRRTSAGKISITAISISAATGISSPKRANTRGIF
mgnify:CR=1 FL=1